MGDGAVVCLLGSNLLLLLLCISIRRRVGRLDDRLRALEGREREAALLAVLLLGSKAAAQSPDAAARAALADAQGLPPGSAVRVRYLSLYARPDKERAEYVRVMAFWINSLSREAEVMPPVLVAPDLLRVNLDDYGIDPRTWDRLADADPYFHAILETVEIVETTEDKVEEYGNWWYNGRVVKEGTPGAVWKTTRTVTVKVPVKSKKKTRTSAAAPWIDPVTSASLIALTQSRAPIVRADWFLYQSGIQRKEVVGYYDFLGLGKSEKDFERLIGADPEVSRRVRREIAGVLGRSGVAINDRRVVRLQSVTGGYWITDDFLTSTGRQNVLRFMDGDTEPPAGDASERYGCLPNGLFAYWLQNAKGERQDVVPQGIALDRHTASNDLNIYAGKSCIACHVEGIRPVNDYARRIYKAQADPAKGKVVLQSPDYAKYVRLRQLYLSDLDGQVKKDQDDFARVLLKIGGPGWTPAVNAKAFEQAWDRFAEADLDLTDVARDLGVTPVTLLLAIRKYAVAEQARVGSYDPVVSQLLADPVVPLRREHLEDGTYTLLQTVLRTYP